MSSSAACGGGLRGAVTSHWFYSPSFEGILAEWCGRDEDDSRLRLYREVRREIQRLSDATEHVGTNYAQAVAGAVLDWVVDHPGGRIVIGGGYWNLCVKEAFWHLFLTLVDMLRGQEIRMVVDPSLCFFRRREDGGHKPWQLCGLDFTADKTCPDRPFP